MNNLSHRTTVAERSAANRNETSAANPLVLRWFVALAIVGALFAVPLLEVLRLSLASHFHSHIPVIPLVSAYFVWLDRAHLGRTPRGGPTVSMALGLLGVCLGIAYIVALRGVPIVEPRDLLSLGMAAFVSLAAAVTAFALGAAHLRQLAFPLGFLVFMIPLPHAAITTIETLLQHGSASAAFAMFSAAATPVLRQDLIFHLPGITLEVAPECSGIRSTLVLFITSIVASYMLLRSAWRRTALVVAVLPLALLRNGFRVFVIGELCVHIGPEMEHSYIHRQGGPIFFALSLVPFTVILYLLIRSERSRRHQTVRVHHAVS